MAGLKDQRGSRLKTLRRKKLNKQEVRQEQILHQQELYQTKSCEIQAELVLLLTASNTSQWEVTVPPTVQP